MGNTSDNPAEARQIQDNRISLAILILISSLMAAGLIYQVLLADLFLAEFSSPIGLAIFAILTIIPYATGLFLFQKLIAPVNREKVGVGQSSYLRLTYNLLKIAYCYNALVLGALVFEVVVLHQFHLGLSIVGAQANTVLLVVILSYLGFKFFSWYRSNRDLSILFFGITFLVLAAGTALADVVQTVFFIANKPAQVENPQSAPLSQQESPNYLQPGITKSDPKFRPLFLAIQLPLRIAFVFYWIASVMLLRKYAETLGRTRFWLLVTAPLVAYAISSIFIYGALGTQFIRGMIASSSSLAGGIFFGIVFLSVSKQLKNYNIPATKASVNTQTGTVSLYLQICAFGTILYLNTNTPPNHIVDWAHLPYPPFGDIVWSFTGFAGYLYSFGIYFSTVAISHDSQLRKSLRKLASESGDMLRSLGSAQMQQEIKKRVVKISKEHEEILKESTGVEQHLEESEIKQYVQEVLDVVQKKSKTDSHIHD